MIGGVGLVIAAVAGAGLGALVAAARELARAGRIGRALAPFGEIAGLRPGGRAEVRGRVVVEDEEALLTGPITREKCAGYHLHLEQRDPAWTTRIDERRPEQLVLDDGSGRVVVETAGAELRFATTARGGTASGSPDPDIQMAVTATYNDRSLARPPLRYVEVRIGADAVVFALGDVVPGPDGEPRIVRRDGSLVLSDAGAANLARAHQRRGRLWALLGLALLGAAVVLALALAGGEGAP